MFLIVLIALVVVACNGLRMPSSPLKAFGTKMLSMPNTAGMIAAAAATPLVLTPTAAMAVDAGGVGLVAVPLLISIFVMVNRRIDFSASTLMLAI
jgi:hypothetical protein